MPESDLQIMQKNSHLSGPSAAYIDALYEVYLQAPDNVDADWRRYFDELPKVSGAASDVSHAAIRQQLLQEAKQPKRLGAEVCDSVNLQQAHVMQLINAYRLHGHHHANLDPLGIAERKHIPDLALSHHHFTEADRNKVFRTESPLTFNGSSLDDILSALKSTYCGDVGVEYMHITDNDQLAWLQQRLESVRSKPQFAAEEKINILKQLTAAEGLEKYLGEKYVGQKRFSLEGGDSFIPMIQGLIDRAGTQKVREVVIGMAHRGRLNVLVNVLGKAPEELFQEFEGKHAQEAMSGDVKYHMGFSSDVVTPSGNVVHLSLAFNPSHLEIIGPVVEGSVRSRQRRRNDLMEKRQVMPVLVHGDAAFAGQGVVMETFNFSQARGYNTGGTLHIVINNQIGFTTSNPLDARSTLYCTDIAKMVQAPIFHVNADDPEAVVFVTQIAFDFRMRFKRDVVIDLVCYRRHGHNEADEPAVTQPMMYKNIRQLPTVRQLYADRLISQNVVTAQQVEAFFEGYRQALAHGQSLVIFASGEFEGKHEVRWEPFVGKIWEEPANTSYPLADLQALAHHLTTLPEDFILHPVVKKVLEDRDKMTAGDIPVNWGYAENLAYATLLAQGYPVRISGQDCGRGTFAHRHAVLHDYKVGGEYIPLQHLSTQQEQFIIIDSILSEEAVLGFEYGYASAEPNVLVVWEAQFGDFANGAQVVVDQFISSGEQKWGRLCGLVMLLPHGFEGQGPEHSSARLERYLQLCAQHNMQVCVPSTPAQVFHMLRRQMIRPFRKPLIVMSPKSLLRHKLAVSSLEDLANGQFHNVIPEIDRLTSKKVNRVVLCSGKVYYDLLARRREKQQTRVAILRIEQLYPFPEQELREHLTPYAHVKDIVWCQEEPKNQGAWFSSQHHIRACLNGKQQLHYAGRDFFAAPAVGYSSLHNQQQRQLVEEALGDE